MKMTILFNYPNRIPTASVLFILTLAVGSGCSRPDVAVLIAEDGQVSIQGRPAADADLATRIKQTATSGASVVVRMENPDAAIYPRLHTVLTACWDAGVVSTRLNDVPIKLSGRPRVQLQIRPYYQPAYPLFSIDQPSKVEMFRLIDRFEHPTADLLCGRWANMPLLLATLQVAHDRGLPVSLTLGPESRKIGIHLLAPELALPNPTNDARIVIIGDISGPGATEAKARAMAHHVGARTFVMRTTEALFEESTPGLVTFAGPEAYKKQVVAFIKSLSR